MPDPTAREALESFHSWLVARRRGLVTSAELLGSTHGESDREWQWRAKGLEMAIEDLEIRIAALKDSKAEGAAGSGCARPGGRCYTNSCEGCEHLRAGAYDANGNPRTTPVRMSLPASLCPNIGGDPLDDPNPESETP